jgi:hypothetical protein
MNISTMITIFPASERLLVMPVEMPTVAIAEKD